MLSGGSAAIVANASPAYADVATTAYSIDAPANGVGDVVASPGIVVKGAVTSFDVKFRVTVLLSGAAAGTWVSVAPGNFVGYAAEAKGLTTTRPLKCWPCCRSSDSRVLAPSLSAEVTTRASQNWSW